MVNSLYKNLIKNDVKNYIKQPVVNTNELLTKTPLRFTNQKCKSTIKIISNDSALNHLKDMLELLQNQSASEDMPVFVIRSPAEVPCIPGVAYSRIASKLNGIQQTLSQVNEKMSAYDLNFPSLLSSATGNDISQSHGYYHECTA